MSKISTYSHAVRMNAISARGPLVGAMGVRGLGLIELMIAMVIGLVLVAGAAKVFVNSRKTYIDNESIARLEESARYAMNVIEPDIRMAGYWGLTKDASQITGIGTGTDATVFPGANNFCGNNFAVDLTSPISGSNNQYAMGVGWTGFCVPQYAAVISADTITTRRASNLGSPVTANVFQLCTRRGAGSSTLSIGGACPGVGTAEVQLSNLVVNAYYIDSNSDQTATLAAALQLPSLRRKRLISGPTFVDQEIMPGVEDMQVLYGIEVPGVTQPKLRPTGVAAYFVNGNQIAPLFAANPTAQIVSVRLWLLVRADAPEAGFIDNRVYQYGDRSLANGTAVFNLNSAAAVGRAYQPSLSSDTSANSIVRFRRLLVSRTFQLRNALGTGPTE